MLRYAIICGLIGAVGTASADDSVNKRLISLPELPELPERIQQLRVDATAYQPEAVKDPFQRFNRQVFRFNDAIDRTVLLPTAKFYQRVVPRPVNVGISNFFQNVGEPWTAVNQLLQGKPKASAQSLGRFTLNTLTSLGFADPANSSFNLKAGNEDFGQTLGVWGVKSGPFLVLPLFGPSTLRDATARVVDMAASPNVHIDENGLRAGLAITNVVDTRAAFIGAESLLNGDQYPVLRDVYLQRRLLQVYDGVPPARLNPPVEEGFGDEEFGDEQPDAQPNQEMQDAPTVTAPTASMPAPTAPTSGERHQAP